MIITIIEERKKRREIDRDREAGGGAEEVEGTPLILLMMHQ
jgi:hypothetical protein